MASDGEPKCLPDMTTDNSLGQSSCVVAIKLARQCDTSYTLSPRPINGPAYVGPAGEEASDCICNTVFFSLLSDCSWCQGGALGYWSHYSGWCGRRILIGQYPPDLIPQDTAIPSWAYMWTPSSRRRGGHI
ncbi:hypothetical protein FA13DRAFT_553931 [Coprinellus micaceus]|uniref:Uncharacterized protein n=1 Tax=Coprinellus micaceus TaxID=71717 RepID=A0A4Y7T8H1_COPMI|nr:hypothetical protein FA13DRAFT_553931 [Coprinellus micaceus]